MEVKMSEDLQQTYSEFVQSKTKDLGSFTTNLLHASVGCSGEAGELLDAVKKSWVYCKPLDVENVIEELGDMLFYIQMAANLLNISLSELIELNKTKLNKRYPSGYSDEAAHVRADKSQSVTTN